MQYSLVTAETTVGKLEEVLPDELKKGAIASGNELLLPFAEASAAILLATEHQVAVLGVDAFEVRPDGLATVALFDPSCNIALTGDWKAYVTLVNAESSRGSTNIASGRITAIS
jgi:hypothetical protein